MSIKGILAMGAAGAAMALQGCASVSNLGATGLAGSVEQNAATLNEAHTKAMTAIIAVNVLRARDRWPTNYTTLSGIRSNPTMAVNGSASFGPLGLGNAPMPFSGSSASVSRNEAANAEYSVNPFANNDKSQSLLRPVSPETMLNYWEAGWPRETLMWLFVDAVHFPGSPVWRIDGDEFGADPSEADRTNTTRYLQLIERAQRGEVDFAELPPQSLDERECSPYDPVYLRETLGGAPQGLGDAPSWRDTVDVIERLTGKELILAPDTRASKPANEPAIAPDRYNRRLLLCEPAEASWGFIDARTKAPIASVDMRSFDDMIYFLGETLRAAGPEGRPDIGGVTLFQPYLDRGGRQFAVRVEHAGRAYYVAPQSPSRADNDGIKDVTGNVLSLLNQLYQLAQSDEFLRAPEARLR